MTTDPKFADSGTYPDVAPAQPAASSDDLQRLRELLFGDELHALEAARAHLAEIERVQAALPQRLPLAFEAIDTAGESPRIARALARPVASALGAAVRENRQTVVDTLFPIIGPLIRKSIAEALRNLVADLNGAIESSFTLRGLKWRMEAWRGGVPYAQIVLKHRLSYRIDHVFLIARESGLVLQHESAPDLPPLDADAIAGMLTAIGDFVGDSVGQGSGNTLESAQVGEYLVRLVQGPRANLACFIRGVPPPALRSVLEQRLEEIHAQLDDAAVEHASADLDLSAAWHEALQPLALSHAIGASGDAAAARVPSRWPLLLGVLAVLIALTWFFARREQWEHRVDALRARLQAQPGFVLTGIDAEPWRRLTVHGLVDPDAGPLGGILDTAGLAPARANLVSAGYLSTDDAIVTRRAQRLLAPPASVRMAINDGVLKLDGRAPAAWIAEAHERASWIAGVHRVEFAVAEDVDPVASARAELAALGQTLDGLQVRFSEEAAPVAEAQSVVADIVRTALRAQALAATAQAKLVFVSIGSNDEIGGEEVNQRVRDARAHWLADALAAHGVVGDDGLPIATGEDVGLNRRSARLQLTVEVRQR